MIGIAGVETELPKMQIFEIILLRIRSQDDLSSQHIIKFSVPRLTFSFN